LHIATTHTTNPLYAFLAYRFHFNGKEADNEVKGENNSYDFHARILDPRLGKWLSRDPAQQKYPSISPYVAMGNNALIFIDIEGCTLTVAGNVQQAVADLQSLAPEGVTVKLVGANQIILEGYENLPPEIKKYEGVTLLNDLITSSKNYKYTVGDKVVGINRDNNQSEELVVKDPTNATWQESITNLSVTERGDGTPISDQANDLPEVGFDGSVRISDGSYSTYVGGVADTYVEVPRVNVVFHELKENFLRTEGNQGKGMSYKDAHKASNDVGITNSKQLGVSNMGVGKINTKLGDSTKSNFQPN